MPARVPQEESVFSKKRFSALNLCYFVFGFLIPLIIFIFLLAQASALKPFLRYSINNDFLKTIFFMKTESSSHFSFKFINIIFSVDFIILGALIILPFWLLRNKRQGEKFIIFFVLFIVSVLGLFSALHRWRQDFLLLSQYLILLVSPLLFFHYERICSLISKRRGEVYGVFCSFLLLAFFCLPALSYIYHASKSHGISFWVNKFDTILSLTNKDDKCISVEYACPFRLSSYFYRLCPTPFESSLLTSYTEKSLMNDILHHDIVVIMPLRDSYKNYMRDLNRLIREHYILYRNSFLVPGNNFTVNDDSAIVFNVLVAGYYRVGPDGAGMSIDSKLIKTCSVYLSKGEHLVSVPDKCKKYQLVYDFEANKK